MNPLLPPTQPLSDVIHWHGLDLEVERLFSSMLVTGQPGSGKSRTCIRELLRAMVALNAQNPDLKTGLLLIDPKGWELRQWVTEALAKVGREQDLIVVSPTETTFNPLADSGHTPAQIATQLITATNVLGGETTQRTSNPDRFWAHAEMDLLTCMVAMASRSLQDSPEAGPLTLEHLVRLRPLLSKSDAQIVKLAADLALELDEPFGSSLIEFAALPANTRACVVSSVGTTLALLNQPPLSKVLIPEPNRPQLDMNSIINEGKVVMLDVSLADNAGDLMPAALWLKSAFAKLILSRRRAAGRQNQVRPVFAIIEEFQRVLTPSADSSACEANLLDMSRASRCGVILCTQSVSSLIAAAGVSLVDRLVSLAATHVFYSNTDSATAALASRSLGQRTIWQKHRSIAPASLPPPLLFPHEQHQSKRLETITLVPATEPVLPPEKLARLSQGRFWVRLADGTAHEIQADVSAP